MIEVVTSGCFDVLHAGHVDFLQRARALGDRLTVLIPNDKSVTKLKGPGRPANTAQNRILVLQELRSVDRVICFTCKDPCSWLANIKPSIYVKGDEYQFAEIPEEAVAHKYGIQMVYLPHTIDISTTKILQGLTHETTTS